MKIKICGLARACDAEAVNLAVPDYIGFVFWERSRRNVTAETAERLRGLIKPEIISVGVFVDAEPDFICGLYRKGVISVAQLHGNETQEDIGRLRRLCPGLEIWKAFIIGSASDIEKAKKAMPTEFCSTAAAAAEKVSSMRLYRISGASGFLPADFRRMVSKRSPADTARMPWI